MATLNHAQLSSSTLTSKTIHKSKLRNCTLIHVTLHNSDVAGSVLKNCIVYDCDINSSKFSSCKIYGDKFMLKCEFEACKLLPSQPTLQKLPVHSPFIVFLVTCTYQCPTIRLNIPHSWSERKCSIRGSKR